MPKSQNQQTLIQHQLKVVSVKVGSGNPDVEVARLPGQDVSLESTRVVRLASLGQFNLQDLLSPLQALTTPSWLGLRMWFGGLLNVV